MCRHISEDCRVLEEILTSKSNKYKKQEGKKKRFVLRLVNFFDFFDLAVNSFFNIHIRP
jgi:hypothetical protein